MRVSFRQSQSRSASRGLALVSVLMIVSASIIVLTAILAIRLGQQKDIVHDQWLSQGSLGEDAAFADLQSKLLRATFHDDFLIASRIVESADGPYRTLFSVQTEPEVVNVLPLFSGADIRKVEPDRVDLQTGYSLLQTPLVPLRHDEPQDPLLIRPYPTSQVAADGSYLSERERIPVESVIVPLSGKPNVRVRYAYWLEDLKGLPDPQVHQAASGVGVGSPGQLTAFGFQRADPRGEAGVILPTEVGGPFSYSFTPEANQQRAYDFVQWGLSPKELALVPWSSTAEGWSRHPYAGLLEAGHGGGDLQGHLRAGIPSYLTRKLIPLHHGYADEGTPAYRLNRLVSSAPEDFADIIARNLPDFAAGRRGGLPSQVSYLRTLAASAMDYTDEDSIPTTGADFRGVDAFPLVNELFLGLDFVSYLEAPDDEWTLFFEMKVYAEFWNPFNQEARLENVLMPLSRHEKYKIRLEGGSLLTRSWVIDEDTTQTQLHQIAVDPGGFQVREMGRVRFRVNLPRTSSPSPVVQDFRGQSSTVLKLGYEVTDAAGRRFDRSGLDPSSVGLRLKQPVRKGGVLLQPGDVVYTATEPALFPRGSDRGSYLGDPLMSWYSPARMGDINTQASVQSYISYATPGYRNAHRSRIDSGKVDWRDRYDFQVATRYWPDGGHDAPFPRVFFDHGESPVEVAARVGAMANEGAVSPYQLSNKGRFFSVAELGRIHDPMMWRMAENPTKNSTWRWTALTGDGKPQVAMLDSIPVDASPSDVWGGGNTLRIGRKEHENFDEPGLRASALLDLFHVGFPGGDTESVNLSEENFYQQADPRRHLLPLSAADETRAKELPFRRIYSPELHAGGDYQWSYGKLNINGIPTQTEMELLLRFPAVVSHLRTGLNSDAYGPAYASVLSEPFVSNHLREESIPLIAADLMRARPFVSDSHLARVFAESVALHRGVPQPLEGDDLDDRRSSTDAEREAPFSRVLNLTQRSSRNFRAHVVVQVEQAQAFDQERWKVVHRREKVAQIFMRPQRDPSGRLTHSIPVLLSVSPR